MAGVPIKGLYVSRATDKGNRYAPEVYALVSRCHEHLKGLPALMVPVLEDRRCACGNLLSRTCQRRLICFRCQQREEEA